MVCPRCQFENLPASTFCTACGHRFVPARLQEWRQGSGPYPKPVRFWQLAALTLVLPGLGQLVVGKRRQATVLGAGAAALALLSALLVGHPVFIGLPMALFGLQLYAAVDVYLGLRQQAGRPAGVNELGIIYGSLAVPLACAYLAAGLLLSRWFAISSVESFGRYGYIVPNDALELGDRVLVDRRAYRARSPAAGELIVHEHRRRIGAQPPVIAVGGMDEVAPCSAGEVCGQSLLVSPDGSRRVLSAVIPREQIVGRAVAIYYPIHRRRWL